MLNGVWSLENVPDVEGFCEWVAKDLELTPDERDDLIAYLLGEAWVVYLGWDRFRNPSFRSHLAYSLRLRVVDYTRSRFRTKWQFKDRTYERPKPVFVPLDSPVVESLRSRGVDTEEHSDPDLRRTLDRGDSAKAWEAAEVGQRPSDGTTERAA